MKAVDKTFAEQEINYKTVHAAKSRNDLLMLYEGLIATFYWECLSTVLNKLYPNFHFKSRKNEAYSWNMNASDEINALLNYGYAILESK